MATPPVYDPTRPVPTPAMPAPGPARSDPGRPTPRPHRTRSSARTPPYSADARAEAGPARSVRDRYFDLLRAVALFRVVLYHT